jgi:hypothetical protein
MIITMATLLGLVGALFCEIFICPAIVCISLGCYFWRQAGEYDRAESAWLRKRTEAIARYGPTPPMPLSPACDEDGYTG